MAGVAGLGRPVWNVGIIAGTEMTKWVKPGAMLLSTGHPLNQNEIALPSIVEELNEREISCLAIRPGEYNFDFDRKTTRVADKLGLPILELSDTYAFDDILIDVLGRINLSLRDEANFVERVHEATTNVIIEGGSLNRLTTNMASLLSANVRVFDPRGAVLSQAGDLEEPTPSLQDLESTAWEFGKLREPTHRVRFRLGTQQSPLGFLEFYRMSAVFGPIEFRAAEKVATVVALALAQRSAVQAVEANYQREILRQVLHDKNPNSQEIAQRFRDIGWVIEEPLFVGVVEVKAQNGSPSASHIEKTMSWLQTFALPIARDAVPENAHRGVAVVIGTSLIFVGSAHHRSQIISACQRIIHVFNRRARLDLGQEITIGISSDIAQVSAIQNGYKQAQIAARSGELREDGNKITFYDELGVLGTVLAATTDPHYQEAHIDALDNLDGLPAHEREELTETLRVIFRNNLNLAESARILHCHYNTVRRRVERLEELLGPFTTDADSYFSLGLSLRIRDFKENRAL